MREEVDKNLLLFSPTFTRQKEYWLEMLAGDLEKTTLGVGPGSPAAEPGPGDSARVRIPLTDGLADRLIALGDNSDLAIYILCLTALKILVYRYTGNDDIVVVSPVCKLNETRQTINDFVFIRDRLTGGITFKQLLSTISQSTLSAYENQDYPHEKILEFLLKIPASEIQPPLWFSDLVCTFARIHDTSKNSGLSRGNRVVFSWDREGNRLRGDIFYQAGSYDNDYLEQLARHFVRVLTGALADVDQEISHLPLLTEEEKKRLVFDFNDTAAAYARDKTLHTLFAGQARQTPDVIALNGEVHGTGPITLTYRALNQKANRWAWELREKRAGKDTMVAIMAEKSPDTVIGILGILKAGAGYLPIDPDYPGERLNYMLADSAALYVLTPARFLPLLETKAGKHEAIPFEDLDSSTPGKEAGERPNPRDLASAKDLAYMMYTSGSTGTPKGVLVTHRNATRLVLNANYVELTAKTRILQTGAPVFDATTFEIWGALLHGGLLAVVGDQVILEARKLANALKRYAINTLWLSSPLFNQLIRQQEDLFSGLRYLLVGGDALVPRYINLARRQGKELIVINGYGPTENTTFSVCFPIDSTYEDNIPIGKPISNSTAYILDRDRQLRPPGAAGELWVGGDGVCRGYLNSPELTAEKFCLRRPGGRFLEKLPPWTPRKNVLLDPLRIYKTGDLARWLPDGKIQFLGRVERDRQVKIRGFRVELGEIETALLEHRHINETLVTAQTGEKLTDAAAESPDKFLCAYIVAATALTVPILQEFLAARLPAYMIPSYFVLIDEIPLTGNGKIDRRALPDPKLAALGSDRDYAAPRTPIEKKLSEICKILLGRDKIGIHDNFFEIGGDSIKAIQIASRMSRFGYKLEVAEIFQNPLISAMAARVKKMERIAAQTPVTGMVPLTPIQHAFFANQKRDRHHFNQSVMLFSREPLAPESITAVFSRLQEHHDALRLTYPHRAGTHVQTNNGVEYPVALTVHDFTRREDADAALEKEAARIQASINLEQGPLMKLALFHLNHGDYLLVAIHHLVIDGISWRILFEDIENLYRRYQNGKPLELPLKTDSFKLWSERLSQYADSEAFLKEKTYWLRLESTPPPPLPLDFAEGEHHIKDSRTVSWELSERETQLLLGPVNDAFGTELNDILLTALGLALKATFGNDKFSIAMEGHGREEILPGVDVSRTVGWFTCVYPLFLDFSYDSSLSRQIKEVKESLRRVPHKGIGHGILKYLTAAAHKKKGDFKLQPQVSFNYLGQFDADVAQMSSFSLSKRSRGNEWSPNLRLEYPLSVIAMVVDKSLRLSVAAGKNQVKAERLNALKEHYRHALGRLISYCETRTQREITPSDLTYRALSIDALDGLTRQYALRDVYPLSPMQEGIFFHTLYDKSSPAYFVRISYRMHGELNIDLVKKSLAELYRHYDILRTVFVSEGLEQPLQLVLADRSADFYYENLGPLGDKQKQENYIHEFKAKDLRRSFDLARDILMRVAILQLEEAEYEILWSYHHILMDGWCISLINRDFFEIYNSCRQNKEPRLLAPPPYRDYIRWLEKQDKEAAKEYWKNYLDSYRQPAVLPRKKPPALTRGEAATPLINQSFSFRLSREQTRGLNRLAEKAHVTLNSVLQCLWGVILGKYSGKEDVVFGTVISGRPPQVPGVETMVGLFLNTIPVRIRFSGDTTFHQLCAQVQEQAIKSEPHHYCPLAEIQTQSTLRQNLFDHIMAFENYPMANQLEEAVDAGEEKTGNSPAMKIANVGILEQDNYDFDFIVLPGEQLGITLLHNRQLYDIPLIEGIARHIGEIVDKIIMNGHIKIKDIKISHPLESIETTLFKEGQGEFGF
jgi:amino acid adenylation domain-containing protein/non-ribosomal peptide synthase protein (TIGR01720 family)